MVHTEVQIRNGTKYYYRTLSVRENDKFSKIREYLGKELTKSELKEKERDADFAIKLKFNRLKKFKIGERKLYKQSGAGLAITMGMPMMGISTRPTQPDKDLVVVYKGDMLYAAPDFQFLHYFLSDEMRPFAREIFSRMEKDPSWMKKRIADFENATRGFEEMGKNLLDSAEDFSEKNKNNVIKIYEEFLQKDYDYWNTSLFIDLFDPFEKEIMNFIFGNKELFIKKDDLQFLLLPERSVYWEEKEEFNKIKEEANREGLSGTNKLLWDKLKKHSDKYWWISNDYQKVQKMGASDFLSRLHEKSDAAFWRTITGKKKELINLYALDEQTVERLKQFTDMAYLRDVRKKYTQIANYFIVTFFHAIAKKMDIPVEWSDFVVPYLEHNRFFNKDKDLLRELELRTKNGVWMLGEDVEWKTLTETSKARDLFALVEGHLKGGRIIYGNSACLGKAIGPAKIILRQSDFGKFKEGDVLVTGMTRPEYLPLMKIASAIITDEGGVTSHAAIISRELGKPCIIGTKTATKTFRDGDILEVNANHGLVKILDSVRPEDSSEEEKEIIRLLKEQKIVQRAAAYPAFVLSIGKTFLQLDDYIDYSYSGFAFRLDYNTGSGDFCYLKDDFTKIMEAIKKEMSENPNFLVYIKKLYEKQFLRVKESYEKQRDNINKNNLLEVFKMTQDLIQYSVGIAHLIEPFSIVQTHVLKDLVSKKIKDPKEMNRVLNILVTPEVKSFANRYDEDLFKIFQESDGEKREKMIEEHLKKWSWIKNSYAGSNVLTRDDLFEQKNSLKIPNDNYFVEVREQKKQAIEKYGLDKEIQRVAEQLLFITLWQDERKERILYAVGEIDDLLKRIVQEFGVNYEDLILLISDEIISKKFLEKDFDKEIEKRKKCYFWFFSRNLKDYEKSISGRVAEELYEKFSPKNSVVGDSLNGTSASTGSAIGRVYVCKTLDDIKNFKQGDVLVASMTRPEYFPAMKKAVAIITDEGGITSHAAIVARELGIPAIIGTKNATSVLKTGDLVEVKANHGAVIILERKK